VNLLGQTLVLASALTRMMWSNATMQSRVTVSRYHASQLPQPLPQYYTMIGHAAADAEDVDLHGVCRTLLVT